MAKKKAKSKARKTKPRTIEHKIKRSENKHRHSAVIYTTSTCQWCAKVKELLKKMKVSYKEFDVGADESARREMMLKTGQMGVPVIVIDGTKIVIGFDDKALKKALKE